MSLLLISCGERTGTTTSSDKPDKAVTLAGTWVLKSRVSDGAEQPATQRLMRLVLNEGGTFRADYRGHESQKWVRAGEGGFRYEPPILTFHWDSGAVSSLLVRENDQDRLVVHHGRNLAPLKEQDPPEVFVRLRPEKGPTK